MAPRRVLGTPSSSTTTLRAVLVAVVLCVTASFSAGPVLGEEGSLDPSDVVLAFDFSNSILMSETGANLEFAQALDKIADRVAETQADLIKGDATISVEAFGRKAIPYPGCTDIALGNNPAEVQRLEECLRSIAREYRAGGSAPIAKRVGASDTDHVAALRKAATFLPAGSQRPAVIFFTDGQNDPPGKARDNEDVAAKIQPAYQAYDPLAILPVGLGEVATQFETELQAIHIQNFRGMDPCEGRPRFEWPEVVFPSPEAAGDAVALALQEVTCSFTVAPTPTPTPTPTPVPTPVPSAPGAPQGVAAEPTNEGLLLTWTAPASIGTSPITGYTVHCRRTDEGAWGPPTTAGSTLTETQLNGLEPGYPYECQVAAINSVGQGPWSAATIAVAPLGLPPAPGKPSAEAGNAQADVSVPDPGELASLVDGYRFECADGEAGKAVSAEGASREVIVAPLVNGAEYTCIAFASNELGTSSASPASDAFRPCSNLFECNPWTRWLALILAILLAMLLLWLLVRYVRGPRRWLTAVLDDGDTTGLGWGPKLGARIERDDGAFAMRSDRRTTAPIRLRDLRGGHVEVTSAGVTSKVRPGQSTQVTDDDGFLHNLILRRYSRPPKPPKPPEEDPWSSTSRSSASNTASADEEVWS